MTALSLGFHHRQTSRPRAARASDGDFHRACRPGARLLEVIRRHSSSSQLLHINCHGSGSGASSSFSSRRGKVEGVSHLRRGHAGAHHPPRRRPLHQLVEDSQATNPATRSSARALDTHSRRAHLTCSSSYITLSTLAFVRRHPRETSSLSVPSPQCQTTCRPTYSRAAPGRWDHLQASRSSPSPLQLQRQASSN